MACRAVATHRSIPRLIEYSTFYRQYYCNVRHSTDAVTCPHWQKYATCINGTSCSPRPAAKKHLQLQRALYFGRVSHLWVCRTILRCISPKRHWVFVRRNCARKRGEKNAKKSHITPERADKLRTRYHLALNADVLGSILPK